MSLFAENIKNHDKLNEWCKQLGIQFNCNLKIKDTVDKGIGVFYVPGEVQPNDEKVELLRIPRLSSFNMYTLRTLINEHLDKDDLKIPKACLNILFRHYGVSESIIIIGYFISFLIICKKKIGSEKNAWVNNLETYLDILLNTNVGNLYTDQQNILEDTLMVIPGNAILRNSIVDIIGTKWIEVVNEINEEFDEFKDVEIEEVLQIISAIRSRVLEIPREVEKNEGGQEEEDIGDIGDDYYVDVTLVPVLDFVNHDNNLKNAHFDIDRETSDILLYLDLENVKKDTNDDEIEVFISYDPYEDLHAMFVNYGFLPKNENVAKLIDIPIIGYMGRDEDNDGVTLPDYEATRRLYLLKQTPNVQFKIEFGPNSEIKTCKIIDREFYSYLIFDEDIDWDKLEEEEEEREQIAYVQAQEEEQDDEAIELDFVRGFEQCYDLVDNMSEEHIEKLKAALSDYIVTFWKRFGTRIEKFTEIIREYELPHGESTNISKLLEFYQDLGRFISREAAGGGGLWGCTDVPEMWVCVRLRPMYNFGAVVSGVEIGGLQI